MIEETYILLKTQKEVKSVIRKALLALENTYCHEQNVGEIKLKEI